MATLRELIIDVYVVKLMSKKSFINPKSQSGRGGGEGIDFSDICSSVNREHKSCQNSSEKLTLLYRIFHFLDDIYKIYHVIFFFGRYFFFFDVILKIYHSIYKNSIEIQKGVENVFRTKKTINSRNVTFQDVH